MNIAEKLKTIKIAGHPLSDAEQAAIAQAATKAVKRPVARRAIAPRAHVAMDAALKTLRAVPDHDIAAIAAAIRMSTHAFDSAGEYVDTGNGPDTRRTNDINARLRIGRAAPQRLAAAPASSGVNAAPDAVRGIGVNAGFVGPAGGAVHTVNVAEQEGSEARQAMDAAIRAKLHAIKRR